MKKLLQILKLAWMPVVLIIAGFGVLFYVLFIIPLTAYLVLLCCVSLGVSLVSLQLQRRAAVLEKSNYENWKVLRARMDLCESDIEELKQVSAHYEVIEFKEKKSNI